jgi:small-conductance mechanosensitive channel
MENTGVSKLEVQLREAKLKMIKDRIQSKEEKIADIKRTYAQVEKEIQDRAAKRQSKPESKEGLIAEQQEEQAAEQHEEITAEEAKLIAEANNLASDTAKSEE